MMGSRGAVATSQPLAVAAGMEMFYLGGNAVDAAIATAIALTVVEPTSNGIGSDAFAIVWDGKIHGLNGSGKSPQNLTLSDFAEFTEVPERGWHSVTVPGAVSAWRALWERWGKLPFETLFIPAIRYAELGFPVAPVTSILWKAAESIFLPLAGVEFEPFKKVFFPKNRAPAAGEIWASQLHAETLREIAATGGESFYRDALAQSMVEFANATGGYLNLNDLATHQAEWVAPISTNYRGLTVWEIGSFGVMGAAMQPQGHLQVVTNMADYDMNPQAALDAPRWRFNIGSQVFLEPSVPQLIAQQLSARGHDVQYSSNIGLFGRGQIICKHNGVFIAASDYRADGLASVW